MSPGELGRRLRALVLGRRADRETAEELRIHLEMAAEALIAEGVEPVEARRRARLRLGSPDAVREAARDERGARWIEDAVADLRHAARQLRRSPGFALVAVLTLGLGIGATAAIFSVVDGVLLRPSPLADAERLVVVWQTDRDSGTLREPSSWPDFLDFGRETATLEGLAAVVGRELTHRPPSGDPERLSAVAVSAGYLPLVGIEARLGGTFTETDDRPGGSRVALLGEGFWRRRFASDPAVLGAPITLDGETYSIRGVLPAGADFGLDQIHARAAYHRAYTGEGTIDVWLPLQADADASPRDTHPFLLVGRLAPGADVASADAELSRIAADLESAYPDSNRARGAFVEALDDVVFAPVRPTLNLLATAVALLLLVACLNVSNLLLARGARRGGEVALRSALGASAGRLARQFLAENALLATLGTAGGALVAGAGLRTLIALAPADLPRLDGVRLDGRAFALCLALAAGVTLALGALPTLQALRLRVAGALRDEGRGATGGASPQRLRRSLVTAEVALSVALLLATGLLVRSFRTVLQTDAGFRAEGVQKAEYQLPETRYPRDYSKWPRFDEIHSFNRRLLERVRALPGVTATAIAGAHPLDPGFTNSFVVVGREAESQSWPEISIRPVSPEYFAVVDLEIVAGRGLSDADGTDAAPVLVVNRTAARRFFGDRDPIGERIRFWGTDRRIVGVAEDERFRGLDAPPPLAVYAPVAQLPASAVVLARTDGDPAALARPIREALREIDPELAVYGEEPLAETVRGSVARRRFAMLVLAAFGATSVALALVGVYGVVGYAVAERTREIGLRAALGASRGAVVGLLMRNGLRMALVGTTVGMLAAALASRALTSLLHGISPLDPATWIATPSVLLAAALAATWLPAWRAASIEPVDALRHE